MKEANIDIAFVQEPYNYQNQVTGIPRNYKIFTSGRTRKRAAVVVINKRIDAILIDQLSDEDTVVIEITYGNLKFIATSIYMDSKKEIASDLHKIENIQRLAKDQGLIVAMDSNARSTTWYDAKTNRRGKILEEFILSNRLNIANEDCAINTFESTMGASNIDLTIADNKMIKLLHTWQCNEQESLSDHRFITFDIETHKKTKQEFNYNGVKYITSEKGFQQFKTNLIKEIKINFKIRDTQDIDDTLCELLTLEPETENAVRKYQDSIEAASKKSFKVRQLQQKTVGFKAVPWWTVELTAMRKKTNAMRRRYQRTLKDNNLRETRKLQYLQEKRKYEATLRKSKIQSWKQYCNATTAANPWNMVFKLATDKIRNSNTLSTIRRPDGTVTSGMEETLNIMIEHFTPADDEATDNDYHKLIRLQNKTTITTEDDKLFTTAEIRDAIYGMNKNKAPGEDGITSEILQRVYDLLPKSTTAIYNGCLRTACFPKIWKRAKLIPIVKPGKETCEDMTKYRPISLLNTAAKVLEKVLINRIMYHAHSNNLINKNQYGFTPQTSTVDAVMALKNYVQNGIEKGQYIAAISLDVKGAFDAAWWPGILTSLRNLRCPGNLYKLCENYFKDRTAILTMNNCKVQRNISKGCPQGSASSPGFWNIFYNSLLNLEYSKNTKIIAYADDLMILVKGSSQVEVENYANIETQKVATWARNNKTSFNDQKSKVLVITKKKPKNKRDIRIFLNNKKLQQTDTLKYLGITIDRRFNFNQHIENITGKCIKTVYSLSKSAKINWGLKHEVLRIIYNGAILPIIAYGAPVWIECIKKKHNAHKIKRVQRLINLKIARAYRTTSHEALCVLTGITPILIELENQANLYYRTRENEKNKQYDAPVHYSQWNHPAKALEIIRKTEGQEYTVEIYTDGSKNSGGVGSGIVIFENNHVPLQLKYRLAPECSNNQAEQLAIVKALQTLRDFRHLQGLQRTAVVHTDSNITLDAIQNPRNHQRLIEQIREEIRALENDKWSIHFTWVKAHNDNLGNEMADQLAKDAASNRDGETAYSKIPKSAIIKEIKEKGETHWQQEWNASTKGETTKSFFPNISERKSKRLQMGINLSTIVTGHGTLRSYYYRFKIKDDPTCVCRMGPQNSDHIIWECALLQKQRDTLKNRIRKTGGNWPLTNSDLVNNYTKWFQMFVNSINFDTL